MPNPGFEDTIMDYLNSCRGIPIGIFCKYWSSPNLINESSSDYVNIGSTGYQSAYNCIVPLPHSGLGYGACGLFESNLQHSREYLMVELLQELKKDEKYCVEFYVFINKYQKYAIENVQAAFVVNFILQGAYYAPMSNISPQITNNNGILLDTTNWIKINGEFIANGGEKYMIIGNFNDNQSTNYQLVNWGNGSCWFAFDDVKVYYCGPDTTEAPVLDTLVIPNVFTPNGDGYNDKFEYKNQEQWNFETSVYNRWGGVVYENASSQNWDGHYRGNKVSAGVYFYIIKAQAIRTGEVRVYKGHVTVMY